MYDFERCCRASYTGKRLVTTVMTISGEIVLANRSFRPFPPPQELLEDDVGSLFSHLVSLHWNGWRKNPPWIYFVMKFWIDFFGLNFFNQHVGLFSLWLSCFLHYTMLFVYLLIVLPIIPYFLRSFFSSFHHIGQILTSHRTNENTAPTTKLATESLSTSERFQYKHI